MLVSCSAFLPAISAREAGFSAGSFALHFLTLVCVFVLLLDDDVTATLSPPDEEAEDDEAREANGEEGIVFQQGFDPDDEYDLSDDDGESVILFGSVSTTPG